MSTSDNFSIVFEKLLKNSVNSSIITDSYKSSILSNVDLAELVSTASIVSLSEDAAQRSLAYEICSRLIESNFENLSILACADMILSRIGNFPGRHLLREKFSNGNQFNIPVSLSMERIARDAENSIDGEISLTDFQYKLYYSLLNERSLSVSAPTSAGKSFVLNLDLVRRLKSSEKQCIIYVVPTRALVAEVVVRIRSTVRFEEIDDVIIRTAPFPVSQTADKYKIVFVLTQERLLSLLAANKEKTLISLLIVDEAHELQKGKRGILLQNAIDLALYQSPSASLFFASPLIRNPGYLLNVFSRHNDGQFFTEEISPVSQNIILVSPVSKKPNFADIDLLSNKSLLRVGRAKLSFIFRNSVAMQKARFAVEICKDDESAIIFAGSAAEAEKVALCASSCIENFVPTDDILDFIKFIRSEIHEEYPLVDSLSRGVGFHYGNMPSIVRSGIERFFKEGSIKFLCCTSTLLQGVNLPAKHIVIFNPHLGTEPMGRADFRNLAGRAGRLLKEFHGNIWCIRPTEWDIASFDGENLQEISSAMNDVMADGGTLIENLRANECGENDRELADAAFSRLFHELRSSVDGVEQAVNRYLTDENTSTLKGNIDAIKNLQIDLPTIFLDSHRSLRPDLLQKLYDELRSLPYIDHLLLINPREVGGKQRMSNVVKMIYRIFEVTCSDLQFNLICGIAHDWAWGTPIGEMLSKRVSYLRGKNNKDSTSQIIRDFLGLIEKEVRFNLVRYFAAFEDLVGLVALEKEPTQKKPNIAAYHVYLEFGSSDNVTLGLMALGLSRFSAMKLASSISWGDAKEPEEFMERIKSIRINKIGLPKICQLEVMEMLG